MKMLSMLVCMVSCSDNIDHLSMLQAKINTDKDEWTVGGKKGQEIIQEMVKQPEPGCCQGEPVRSGSLGWPSAAACMGACDSADACVAGSYDGGNQAHHHAHGGWCTLYTTCPEITLACGVGNSATWETWKMTDVANSA